MADPVTIGTAVGWGIKVAGWIVSPIMSKLVNKGFSYLGFRSSDKLRELERKVLQLQLMLEAIEVSPRSDRLETWMKELRNAFYEADDIIDAIDYQHLKNRVLSHTDDKFRYFRKQQVLGIMTDFKVAIASRMKLKATLDTIENLLDEGHKLLSILNLAASSVCINKTPNNAARSCTRTTSAPPVVFGRDDHLTMIRTLLRDTPADVEPSSSRTKCFSVIGIYGIPGSGKTTLAQYVCEKEKDDVFFDLVMWIHVSQNFSVDTVFTEMLEIASGVKRVQHSNLDMMQRELEENLRGKRFFLVLDDVWHDKYVSQQQLDLLISPLKVGKRGSRVLITSRTADAAKALGAQKPIPIPDLDEEQYLSMFMHYALDGAMISDQALLGEYKLIGRKIAGKLGRSPLAARTVAGQLSRRLGVDFWRSTLNRDLLTDTMGALWWSYQQLEEPIRRCFAYCSMFPRRYELKRDELVHMWMAQGFVQTTSAAEDIEDVGHDYFEVLLSISFIQLKSESHGTKTHFAVHDLLHDLAERVAGSDCFTVKKDTDHIPQDVRHLFIDSDDPQVFTEKILNLETLRTIVMSSSANRMTDQDFERIVMNLKKLRVVHVCLHGFKEIPACIGELKHLRYLHVFGYLVYDVVLPHTFPQLYNMQKLSFGNWTRLHCSSSKEMANLVNLRHIECSRWNFPDVGRMTSLRNLRIFTARKTRGYEIKQLEHLDNLRGTLLIQGLENVSSKEEARQAKLGNKIHISDLTFDWKTWENLPGNQDGRKSKNPRKTSSLEAGTSRHVQNSQEFADRNIRDKRLQRISISDPPEEVLEVLRPTFLVTSLNIWNYRGSTYPSWLTGEQSTLENLQHLEFSGCNGSDPPKIGRCFVKLRTIDIESCNWNSLPENMECLAALQSLIIDNCKNIMSLPRFPPSLKTLELHEWHGSDAPYMFSLPENMEYLTSLEILTISNCSNIQSLPRLPKSLKKISLSCCNRDLMESCKKNGHPNWQKIQQIPEKSIC